MAQPSDHINTAADIGMSPFTIFKHRPLSRKGGWERLLNSVQSRGVILRTVRVISPAVLNLSVALFVLFHPPMGPADLDR